MNVLHQNRITPTIRRAERLLNQGEWAKACRCTRSIYRRAANAGISLKAWDKRLHSLEKKLAAHVEKLTKKVDKQLVIHA